MKNAPNGTIINIESPITRTATVSQTVTSSVAQIIEALREIVAKLIQRRGDHKNAADDNGVFKKQGLSLMINIETNIFPLYER